MNLKKSISLVLTLCMVFSLFATFVFPVAAEGTTYTLIDTVEGLTSGTYYMSGVVDSTYHILTGNIGYGKIYTSPYTYADGVLSTDETTYFATAVEVAAVEGKENTYTLYVADKGYISCTDATNNHKLAYSDTACEWEAYANSNGGINFKTTVSGNVAHMGTNGTSSSQFIRQYKDSSAANSLTYGLVFFAEDVEEEVPAVTSQVVTDWNVSDWNDSANGANGAYIFTDADVYATSTHTWWFHAAFAPTDVEGVYEVTAVRAPSESPMLTIPENGFVWAAHDTAAEGTAGAYSVAVISNVAVGNKVTFTGLDIANCTTTADATAEKVVEEPVVDPDAPVSIALGKTYTYPTDGLYYHWSDEWPCTDNVATALTDGVKVAGYYGMGETSGWGGASPNPLEVVIDLEAVYSIDSFAYTVCGGVDGISMPASVAIYVSEDGETFTQVDVSIVDGDITYPIGWTTCGDRTSVATAAAPVNGRYVKFAFTKEGNFVFINELEVFGEEVVEETNDVVVNVNDNAVLTDGLTGFTGLWGEVGTNDVVLIQNGKCTEKPMNVVLNYALGETKTIDAITLDFYHCAGVMIGYPERGTEIIIEYSVDGETYNVVNTPGCFVEPTDVVVGIAGTESTVCEFEAVEAAYVRVTFVVGSSTDVLGDTPADGKVFWEFAALAEVAVNEVNEVVVNVNDNAVLTDGLTGFTGDWGAVGTNDVLLLQNGKCTEMAMKVVLNYALGETKTIDALALDFYHCAGVMIGYPEGQILVEVSVDGEHYTTVRKVSLAAANVAIGEHNTVSTVCEFDAVEAAYVRATFVVGSSTGVLGDNPTAGKVFWEFASLAEVAVNEVPALNEVVVDVNEHAILTDGESNFSGGWGNVGTGKVVLIQNGKCTEMAMKAIVNYALGETKTIDALTLDFYHDGIYMIGYPEGKVLVEYSVDGETYTVIGEFDLAAATVTTTADGTVSTVCEFDAVDAAYVRATFVVGSSTGVLGDNPTAGKVFWEFASLAEVAVNEVSDLVELPEEATGLDYFGYTHTYINHVMYADADMTLGELVTKYFGQSKDLNYFKIIVVNADSTVAATYLTLGRPDGVKTDFTVTAGQYVLALSADGSNEGRFEIADTVNVGDIVTLYNVDFTAEPGELTGAGFTVEAPSAELEDLPSGRGFPVLVPANGSVSYVANFENGADFMLFDTSVTVLVNGVALDASEDYYEAKLEKGDVVTFENATEEDITVYPNAFPVVFGTMSNPFVLEEIGDITADITMDLIMDGGAAHYIYTAPADGKVIVTMLDESWTYTVNHLTAGKYGDGQWSDSNPVVNSYIVEVSAGDEIQIVVGTYDAENPWAVPEGKVNFNVAFEAAKTFVTGEFTEGGEQNKANVFVGSAHNIWNKDFSGNSWWGVAVLDWNVEANAWEVVKVLTSGAATKDGTLTETQIALCAHVDNATAYAAITALAAGDIVYIWDVGVATTDKLVDGVDANGGFYTTDASKTGTTALTYKKVEYLPGDVNMNGKIDANDYATIRKLVVGSVKAEDLSELALKLADVNGNGKIDANDYILVKRHFLGTYVIPAWAEEE